MSQAQATTKQYSPKTKHIRCIQAEIRKQGLKEAEYRVIYEDATSKNGRPGKDSLRAMTVSELRLVILRLRENAENVQDNKPAPKYKGVPMCQSPKARKVRSLWLELRDAGALKDSSEKALLSFVKRSTGVERMEWLKDNQLNSVIEQLKNWLARL